MASTAYDNTIRIYDLRIGETLFTLKAHESAVMSCCFSTFGDYLATGGFDSTIVLWKTNLEQYMNIDVSNIIERKSKSLLMGSETMNAFESKNININSNTNVNTSMQSGSKDNIGESLSNIFERMVSQLDLITNSFTNFDNRLERMEKIVDEMNEEDLKNGIDQ